MAIIIFQSNAKCKHCKFAKGDYPIKKDGTYSKRIKYKCNNPASERAFENITMNDLVCNKWEL